MQNRTLFFCDNLDILREKFPDKPDADGYFDVLVLENDIWGRELRRRPK